MMFWCKISCHALGLKLQKQTMLRIHKKTHAQKSHHFQGWPLFNLSLLQGDLDFLKCLYILFKTFAGWPWPCANCSSSSSSNFHEYLMDFAQWALWGLWSCGSFKNINKDPSWTLAWTKWFIVRTGVSPSRSSRTLPSLCRQSLADLPTNCNIGIKLEWNI